jgi:hypothetical protein
MSTEGQIDEENLAQLVGLFYGRVRADPDLGPIFNDAVADWPEHLAHLTDFWHSGSREHPHHARGRGRVRKAGDALFDRQGLRGDAAPGAKAFYPAPPPFPLLHVDTTWKFREMIEFRDEMARSWAWTCSCTSIRTASRNINPFDHGSALHTDIMKTEG